MAYKPKNKNLEPLKSISALVPLAWFQTKRDIGLSWRQLIARGFRSLAEEKKLEKELNHFLEKTIRLNEMNTSLRAQMFKLSEQNKEMEGRLLELERDKPPKNTFV